MTLSGSFKGRVSETENAPSGSSSFSPKFISWDSKPFLQKLRLNIDKLSKINQNILVKAFVTLNKVDTISLKREIDQRVPRVGGNSESKMLA